MYIPIRFAGSLALAERRRMSEVTRILAAMDAGDPRAAAQLLPLVYDELRKLATGHMTNEAPGPRHAASDRFPCLDLCPRLADGGPCRPAEELLRFFGHNLRLVGYMPETLQC